MKRIMTALFCVLFVGIYGLVKAADNVAAPAANAPAAVTPAANTDAPPMPPPIEDGLKPPVIPPDTNTTAAAVASPVAAVASPAAAAPAAVAPAAAVAPVATVAPAAAAAKPAPAKAKAVKRVRRAKKAAAKAVEAGGPAVIQHVAAPLAIDAGMTPFAAVPSIHLSPANKDHICIGKVTGAADLSADLRIATDLKNIYVACEVTQGRGPVNKQNFDNCWNADCLELYFSSKSSMAQTSRMKKSDYDFQFVMAPTGDSGKPVIRLFPIGTVMKGGKVQVTPTAKGYILTGIIPLSNLLENDWAVGKSYKFDAAVAKASDAGAREKKIFWNATIDAWDNPAMWGIATIK